MLSSSDLRKPGLVPGKSLSPAKIMCSVWRKPKSTLCQTEWEIYTCKGTLYMCLHLVLQWCITHYLTECLWLLLDTTACLVASCKCHMFLVVTSCWQPVLGFGGWSYCPSLWSICSLFNLHPGCKWHWQVRSSLLGAHLLQWGLHAIAMWGVPIWYQSRIGIFTFPWLG